MNDFIAGVHYLLQIKLYQYRDKISEVTHENEYKANSISYGYERTGKES